MGHLRDSCPMGTRLRHVRTLGFLVVVAATIMYVRKLLFPLAFTGVHELVIGS